MRLKVSHRTHYSFLTPPAYGLQQLRLTPKSNLSQVVLEWSLQIEGAKIQTTFEDEHRNATHLISLNQHIRELVITSNGTVDLSDRGGVMGKHVGFTPLWLFKSATPLTQAGPRIEGLSQSLPPNPEIADFHSLSRLILEHVAYLPGTTLTTTTAEQAVLSKAGVCQDHAHILIACARHAGHPARYVSGYLMMNDRVQQDATHAWAEVWIEGLGWVGFDVSNSISPDMRYVRLATGLDYSQASPISGLTIGGSGESISVDVQVQQ